MGFAKKWYYALTKCLNCHAQRNEKFPFGQAASTATIQCKYCGVKGHISIIGPALKLEKE